MTTPTDNKTPTILRTNQLFLVLGRVNKEAYLFDVTPSREEAEKFVHDWQHFNPDEEVDDSDWIQVVDVCVSPKTRMAKKGFCFVVIDDERVLLAQVYDSQRNAEELRDHGSYRIWPRSEMRAAVWKFEFV